MASVVPVASVAPAGTPAPKRSSRSVYILLIPGLAWLAVFFLIPLFTLFTTSLQKESATKPGTYVFGLQVSNYVDALVEYWPQFLRSFIYAGLATLLALAIAYPLAYFIAFKAGNWRSLMLVLVVAPAFASFLLRTYAWKTILADDGFVTSTLNSLHLLPDGRILNTGIAVVAGLTYNFLPFMILPLFASLDRIDYRLIEAGSDLYASPVKVFWRVTWPLSMPGVVAGTLLTFIPAAGDFINAELLGSAKDRMIGNVIQTNFIEFRDYPTASALSFALMAAILILVFGYIRRSGTEDLV
ncbi:MAG: ABC transporter permease [Actinomycetota bacterium]|nr:ABC transporter permease [Actinomycetota bacterium]MDP2288404.1 ABC transporter permease [Actinomycetota bacterium]